MTFLKLLFIVSSYIIYCSAKTNRISCYPRSTPTPETTKTIAMTTTTPEPTRYFQQHTKLPTQSGEGNNQLTTPEAEPNPGEDISACLHPPLTDVIILNDVSCPITEGHCDTQQRMMAQMMLAIKGEDFKKSNTPQVRVGYITFDSDRIYQVVSLTDTRYNQIPVNKSDILSLYDTIRNSQPPTCSSALDRKGDPVLLQALKKAFKWFKNADSKRDPKIIIFSNCKADSTLLPNICKQAQQYISRRKADNGLNIYLVNNGANFEADDVYLMCLAEYDENRIFINTDFNYVDWDKPLGIRDRIRDDGICSHPTPAPTSDPTVDPTADPTVLPTPQIPVPQRRLAESKIQNAYEFDIAGTNSPCITFEIKLETENLLPHNTQPHPPSNIAVIGKAIANVTGGVVTVPDTPDEEDGERLEDFPDYVPWILDENCTIDNQMIDYYMPQRTWSPEFEFLVEETDSGFIVRSEMTTNDSIVYVFRVKKLMLDITSFCSGSIKMTAGIFLNDALMPGTSATTTVPALNNQRQVFVLDGTATLSPGTPYEIRFEFTGSYPASCDFSSFTFDTLNPTRRRLAGAASGEATPSSCEMGGNLAASPDMIATVKAMCNENVNNRADIEAGIFKQQNSDSAVRDHLLKTGSLSLYDMSTGNLTKFIDNFPAHEVQKPCIAVDEKNLVVYAVGGYDNNTGEAVDYIQAYQFTDDTFTAGEILPYDKWRLDQPRYGSSCMIWPNGDNPKLVVVGGMAKTSQEFFPVGHKKDWFNDIRTYPLPDDPDDLFFEQSAPGSGKTCKIRLPMSDMRLLLIDDHTLYMFGGKTHDQSKQIVQRLDLNLINDCTGNAVKEGFVIAEQKALPMTDKVMFDENQDDIDEACYMIFSGQTYLNGAIVPGEAGLNTDLLQVFCNGRVSAVYRRSTSSNGRRLTDGSVGFTEYDAEALEESGGRRRGLIGKELGEKTQVRLRRYEYGLDGVWYNFSVSFELCYANNQELNAAVNYYDSVIDEKPNGEIWKQYAEDISEKILNCSLEAYEGWSNGFGAVHVWDLEKLSVRYDITPSPTINIKTHPERRKARFWWTNLGDRNDDDDWIDDKFHYTDCDESEG